MTRRASQRALAREIYRKMVAARAAQAAQATPTPDPSPQGGGEKAVLAGREQAKIGEGGEKTSLTARNLTEKVRALYEHSAVPVAEIARLAGVTERTIYKYAQKGGWQPRYAWIDRGGVNRRRRWRAARKFAPEKGAGGRFVHRADKGQPCAVGLQATDPAAARRAVAGCGKAARLARAAQAKAEAAQRCEAQIFAIEWTNRALEQLREHREARKETSAPAAGRIERVLMLAVDVALQRWEALLLASPLVAEAK